MFKHASYLLAFILAFSSSLQLLYAQSFRMEQVAKFSFPSELTSSPSGEKIAWAMNEQGKRNIYLAIGPDFQPTNL